MTMVSDILSDLNDLAEALGHRFGNPDLLADAVTHPSVAGIERGRRGAGAEGAAPGTAYERLEFLGDRVLGLVVAQWLIERFPDDREGSLAKRHAALVRREALGRVAERIGLGGHLRLSPGEAMSGGRTNHTILADACEAVIGALFLDGGLGAAEGFIRAAWAGQLDASGPPPQDSKTTLQEWAQGSGRPLPVYQIVRRSGPAHEPEFEVEVKVEGLPVATATGRSRRAAEQAAAQALLLRSAGIAADG
ncbi:MAG: ribonuclease III [Azospirillum sp.]|nr:ribonuclease III [Azospirillum sp.]